MSQVYLGEVLEEQKKTIGKPDGDGLPVIGVSNKIGLIISKHARLTDVSRYKLINSNWFAYNPMRINVGSIGLADSHEKIGIISPDYVVFSCKDSILPEYFYSFIKSDLGLIEISKNTGGSVRERLYFKNLSKIRINLPSITEQLKIVDSLNLTQTATVKIKNECSTMINTTIPNLRKIIIQKSIEGKLVPQNSSDEPADKLIERIKLKKEKLIKDGILKKSNTNTMSKSEPIFELPSGWVWCRLNDVCQINPRNYVNDDSILASFSPMALVSEKYGVSPKYDVEVWSEIKKGFTHFSENDVVVAKITPCFENSKAGIMKDLKNGIGAGTTELHVLRIYSINDVLPDYIYSIIKSTQFLKNGEMMMTGTAGQKRIQSSYVGNYIFGLPPINEQRRIVKNIEKLMKICDLQEEEAIKTDTKAKILNQAILRKMLTA